MLVFCGVHVWTADTPKVEQRSSWLGNLDKILARKPDTVVSGHMTVDAPTDTKGVNHTKSYLTVFDEELAKAKDAAALKSAMEARIPNLGMGVALDIGAKVAKGEMKWAEKIQRARTRRFGWRD